MLLLTSLTAFGRDVTIHVTDQRGAAISGLRGYFDYETFTTDANGDFVITGLGSSGMYTFSYYHDYGTEQVRFSWDGLSSTVTVSLDGYYATFQLVGLSEEELAQVKGSNLQISTQGSSASSYKVIGDGGKVSFWWDSPAISWSFRSSLFGDCNGNVNLEEEKGVVAIAPKNGKYKVSLGEIKGHGGIPVKGATINGVAAEEFKDLYRAPGTYGLDFMAPGYFPCDITYQVVNKDVTVNIDYSTSLAVRFKLTDRDGSGMENIPITLSFPYFYSGSAITTDASGECVAYALPGYYRYSVNYDKPFYSSTWTDIHVTDDDITEEVSLEGATLLQVRLKNAKQFKDYADGGILSSYESVVSSKTENSTRIWSLEQHETEDGDDILCGCLIEKEYVDAEMTIKFQNTTKSILGIHEESISLNGDDVNLEYDLGAYLTAKLTAPEGYQFNGDALIDGAEIALYNTETEILMSPGEHHWTVELQTADGGQKYPYGKEKTFTLTKEGERIVYQFNEEDYSGIKFFVKDENGNPAEGFNVSVRPDGGFERIYARTDANGCCTVFLTEPGNYTYEVKGNVYGNNDAYLPITKKGVAVGEELLQETVSFEGYKRFTLRVKGIEMQESSLPYIDINGISYFHMIRDESVSPLEYFGTMMIPQDTYEGEVIVRDKNQRSGSAKFSVEIKDNDVVKTVDFSTYRIVTLTVNGNSLNSYGDESVEVQLEKEQGWDFNRDDRLLPPGKYKAIYRNYLYNYADTVNFEIIDKDIAIDFKFNPEDFRKLTFKMVNQPEKADFIGGLIDDRIWFNSRQEIHIQKGEHFYVIKSLGIFNTLMANTWPMEGSTFEIADEDKEVEVDLGQYRIFKLKFVLPDGNELVDFYEINLSKGSDTHRLFPDNNSYYALPLGTYNLALDVDYATDRHYGSFTVNTECPDEITVQLSKDPNAVSDAMTDKTALSATMNNGRICVASAQREEVNVCIYDLDGRALWQGRVLPGNTTDTGLLNQGIYLISMEQNGNTRTQKLIVR